MLFQKIFRDFCPTIWAYLCQGLLSHYLDVYCQQENFQRFLSHYTAKDGTRKIDNFVPENFQGFLFHYLGVFVPGTSVPLSGRIRIWFQENFQRFLSHYTAKDGARKNCQCCSRKFSGIFVPLSGRICARGFCPTIWTYIANRKIFREFCPTILPKMAPEKLTILYQKTFRDFCSTIWAYLCQGLLSHYLDVYCQQENFQRFLSHYTAKDGTRKIDNFVPENFQGFLFHYLGVFVPGTSVPLSGRILPTGKFSEIFVPLYCQRWRPKKLSILFQKTFRDFCPTIWAYLCQGLLSHYLDVYCQQENFQRFLSHYTAKDGTRKIGNFVPENFQGFLFHYLGIFVPGTSVPLSGRIRIWFQENFQRFLSHYTAKDGAQKKIDNFAPENFQGFSSHYLGVFVPGTSVPLSGRILPKMAPKKWPIWFQENFQRFLSHYLGVYWGRWRPKNGHLVLKGIFSEAAAAAFSVFSNMVDCSYFAFFDAFVVCCLRPSPSSSSWTSPP